MIDELDLTELEEAYAGTGSEAHRPDLLLKAVILELLEGRLSPAQWCRDIRENLALQWLTLGLRPSRTALYNFRDRVGHVLLRLNAQVMQRAQQEGRLDGRHTMQDGTAVRACASRHRLMNAATLDRRLSALRESVSQDQAGTPFSPPPTKWMARTLAGRLEQWRRYQNAREILEQRLSLNAARRADRRLPEKRVVISVSDPEAVLGRDKEKVFGPIYTAQFVVEFSSQLIVAYDVAPQATDSGTLPGLLDRTCDVLGKYPDRHTVDAGYVSLLDLQESSRRGVELIGPLQENDWTEKKRRQNPPKLPGKEAFTWLPNEQTYVCPQGHSLQYDKSDHVRRRDDQRLLQMQYRCPPEHCRSCPIRLRCCRNPQTGRTVKRLVGEELLDEHRRRMQTPEAQELRRLRGSLIERAFGDAKAHRNLRRFHGRGCHRARAETGLVILAINLLILKRLRSAKPNPNADTR